MSNKKAKTIACAKCGKKVAAPQIRNHVKWKHPKKSPSRNGRVSIFATLHSKRKELIDKLSAVDEAITMVNEILE